MTRRLAANWLPTWLRGCLSIWCSWTLQKGLFKGNSATKEMKKGKGNIFGHRQNPTLSNYSYISLILCKYTSLYWLSKTSCAHGWLDSHIFYKSKSKEGMKPSRWSIWHLGGSKLDMRIFDLGFAVSTVRGQYLAWPILYFNGIEWIAGKSYKRIVAEGLSGLLARCPTKPDDTAARRYNRRDNKIVSTTADPSQSGLHGIMNMLQPICKPAQGILSMWACYPVSCFWFFRLLFRSATIHT